MAHPDAKLLELGVQFEAAVATYQRDRSALEAISHNMPVDEIDDRTAAIGACMDAPRAAIAAASARTLAGFVIKARAAAWPYGVECGTNFPDLDAEGVESIVADLLALGIPKVCGGLAA